MKTGKFRLIISIIALVAALAFAATAVFAWFYTSRTSKTNGLETQMTSGDVIYFRAIPYLAESDDGITYKLADGKNSILDMDDYMPRAGGITGSTTAIIIEMQYMVSVAGDFELNARVHSDSVYDGKDFTNFTENNYLSNAVYMQEMTSSDSGYTFQSKEKKSFISEIFSGENDEEKKVSEIHLNTYESLSPNIEYSRYYVMDYDPEYILGLYNTMIKIFPDDATLNTRIEFKEDIYFTFGVAES